MLINFSVSNFRSFYKSQTFSMKAGKVRNFANHTSRVANTKLLKFKAVYGSNASGKTNLVKAIDFMRSSVVYGINNASISDYCRLNVENANQPSRFEIDIILAEVHYTYGFEVLLSESRFTKEWLFVE
ncbi:MAG: AAA family ATPase, partial [Oscillospiraceae bacterium]|nr:AAA family ATPase [Oscillospiraceae bacterium]